MKIDTLFAHLQFVQHHDDDDAVALMETVALMENFTIKVFMI